ncbi:MAG: hypothetical protein HYX68_13975 [Planctomycetes bacterium]|nr:hypothetical protein [Planctomycetota bacterium]
MRFPSVRQIRRPVYVFSEDGKQTHVDKFRGILKHSPLKPAKTPDPHYLFIFCQDDRDYANSLYTALRSGMASFPGSHQFVGLSISKDQLEPCRLPTTCFQPGNEKQLYSSVYAHLEKSQKKADFAYIIGSSNWKYHRPSPYGAIKAALLQHGVPSQMVTRQLLQAGSQFRFAIPNIALSALAKLGGVPWLIQRSTEPPALVIGIGTTTVRNPTGQTKERYLGYAICMLSNGLFLDLSFFGASTSHNEFLPKLTEGLGSTLDRLEKAQSKVSRISLHVSQFERYDTISAIANLLGKRKQAQPSPVPFELLRLSHDSSFTVMDFDDPGFVAEEGSVVDLAPRHSLVVMEGRQEKAAWRGRKPVTLEVHREYVSNPSLSFPDSLRDVFHLGFVNWRGFGTKTKPATLAYAKLLSERVADMAAVVPSIIDSIETNVSFGSSLWFL